VVAAFFLAQQLPVATQAAEAATVPQSHSGVLDAAYQPQMTSAQLVSATRQALLTAMRLGAQAGSAESAQQASAAPATYTVRAGDSLSAIAGRVYRNADAWPVLYWANHHQIRWANDIEIGQVLRVPAEPAHIPAPPAELAPPAPPAAHTVSDFTPRHASTAPVRVQSAPAPVSQPVQQSDPAPSSVSSAGSGGGGSWPGGAFGTCVVERESGGNPQVMNSSGHYGLYQFSASTWAEYGGSPGDFGHASVAEQEQVFMNALARGGAFNWAPYDGC
jgi:LysM repeat protein